MIQNEIEYIINMLTVYMPSTPHFSSQVVVPMGHTRGGDNRRTSERQSSSWGRLQGDGQGMPWTRQAPATLIKAAVSGERGGTTDRHNGRTQKVHFEVG